MGGRLKGSFLLIACVASVAALSQCKNDLLLSVKQAAKSIHLLSPNGGDVAVPGTSLTIRWEASFAENLSIELLKGGSSHSTITSDAPNSGAFVWHIPADQAMGEDFSLRIHSVKDPEILDDSDSAFIISKLAIVSPTTGSAYTDTGTLAIQWAGLLDLSNTITLSLYKNSVFLQDIIVGTQNDGAYDWVVPLGTLAEGNDYTIRIVNTATSNTHDSNAFALFHAVTVSSPNGSEVLPAGASNSITWTPACAGAVTIELLSGGSPVETLTTSGSGGSYAWATPLLTYAGSTYSVRVTTATTPARSDVSNSAFMILNPPQGVIATNGTYREKIIVAWSSVVGAATYDVYYADLIAGPYNKIGSTAATTYNASLGPVEPAVGYLSVRAVANGVSSIDSAHKSGSRSRFDFWGSSGSSGSGNGQFNKPTDVDVWLYPDPAQRLFSQIYVTDSNNDRVQYFMAGGFSYLGQWGGTGVGDGQFYTPQGLCVDPADGKVYVADMWNHRVQIFNSNGGFLSWWGRDTVQGTGVHGPGTASSSASGTGDGQFYWPWDVAVDSTYVYVVDSNNNRIQKFTKAGVFQGWWGKSAAGSSGWHAPGTATARTTGTWGPGEFYSPEGITVDATTGNVYVADGVNKPIQKFNSAGVYLSNVNWAAKKVSYDQDGHIYAADASGFAMFDPSGTYQGRFGMAGTGPGQFASPSGICVIPNWAPALANVYVADTNNNRIQIMWRYD